MIERRKSIQNIRIVEIPVMKAVYSGPLTDEEEFEKFNQWFSEYHACLKCELFPRDFMWYNERVGEQEWFYALPQHADSDGDFYRGSASANRNEIRDVITSATNWKIYSICGLFMHIFFS